MSSYIVPIILCGGSGTRLWPLSRESYPKQFLSIKKNDKTNISLLFDSNRSLVKRIKYEIQRQKNSF